MIVTAVGCIFVLTCVVIYLIHFMNYTNSL